MSGMGCFDHRFSSYIRKFFHLFQEEQDDRIIAVVRLNQLQQINVPFSTESKIEEVHTR